MTFTINHHLICFIEMFDGLERVVNGDNGSGLMALILMFFCVCINLNMDNKWIIDLFTTPWMNGGGIYYANFLFSASIPMRIHRVSFLL